MSDVEPAASASPAPQVDETGGAAVKNGTATVKGSPNDFLKKVIGKQVIVRLNSGVDYHGEQSWAVWLAWMAMLKAAYQIPSFPGWQAR